MFKGDYRNSSAVWNLARYSFGLLVAIFLLSETGFASSQGQVQQRALVESNSGVSEESVKNQGKIADADMEATRAAAQQATEEGFKLREQGTGKSLRQAIVKLEQALLLWRKVDDKKWEALTLNSIGKVYSDFREQQKALGNYNLALPLWRQVGYKEGEAVTLNLCRLQRLQRMQIKPLTLLSFSTTYRVVT
ncbi:hypothetical protein CAL7716_082750 [Calothrix sp. PCC 7716]|nr:hypothetical protein CAL7716_082750 [Calothrix sp. PCC 7716]